MLFINDRSFTYNPKMQRRDLSMFNIVVSFGTRPPKRRKREDNAAQRDQSMTGSPDCDLGPGLNDLESPWKKTFGVSFLFLIHKKTKTKQDQNEDHSTVRRILNSHDHRHNNNSRCRRHRIIIIIVIINIHFYQKKKSPSCRSQSTSTTSTYSTSSCC
jgi:hypothetical protein